MQRLPLEVRYGRTRDYMTLSEWLQSMLTDSCPAESQFSIPETGGRLNSKSADGTGTTERMPMQDSS